MPAEEEWQTLARAGRRAHAAKVLAARTGMGFKAVDHIEDWFARNCLPPAEAARRLRCLAVLRLIRQHAAGKSVPLVSTMGRRGTDAKKQEREDDGPDLALWWNGLSKGPPDVAVDVISHGDPYGRIQKRVAEYLGKEVRLIWIADPEDRSVTVYRPVKKMVVLGENDTLTGEDVLAGFSCQVADLFV